MGSSGRSWLMSLERAGNRLPTPALLFLGLCLLLVLVSALAQWLGWRASLPGREEDIVARSLLSGEGLRWILTHTVDNFVTFAPVGAVLVAMLGFGVAEHSGLLRVLLERLVRRAPRPLLTWVVVFAGIVSNLAMDVGYVLLIPLAALLFVIAGRPPLAGIAAAFAGVSAGYSANLLIGPVDAILAGMSTEAVALVDADYRVSVAANYYFAVASTLLLSVVGAWVTERWVAPHLEATEPDTDWAGEAQALQDRDAPMNDRRGLWAVGLWTLVYLGLLGWATLPEAGLLREPEQPGFLNSALMQGIVVAIAFYAAIAGWLFGRLSGRYRRGEEVITGMESTMATMASYLVLMFFAAQFVNYFAWSQLGTLLAIAGAGLLQGLALPSSVLLVLFVLWRR